MGHDPQRSGRTILLDCWVGCLLLVVFLAGLACAGLTTALAAEGPPGEPILRLETGIHTALIRRIGVDAAGRMLLTASDDKTARLWSLQDGRLLNRDRGTPRGATPPTPPGIRVRTTAVRRIKR
jgi:hypothetical protein